MEKAPSPRAHQVKGPPPEFLVVGLNHRTAPLAVRERLSVPRVQLAEALKVMESCTSRGVILSTCNRSEFYTFHATSPQGKSATNEALGKVKHFLSDYFEVPLSEVERYLYTYWQDECVLHLFRVTAGLDSMILGEEQILGQVRDAFAVASQANTVHGPLSNLFHQALRVGKLVRGETDISRDALSISRACVELAKRLLGDLGQLRVLVIGAGEAGKLAGMALALAGIREILVTNRADQRALDLAGELHGRAIPFEQMPPSLEEVDIVIGATGAPQHVVDVNMVRSAMLARPDRPLFLIDIAVPRDIDPASREIRNVFLYDVDDLEMVSETNRLEREQEAERAEGIVDQETERFLARFRSLEALPTLIALRKKAESIRATELNRALKKLEHKLTTGELESLNAMTQAIINKFLHQPTVFLKDQQNLRQADLVRELFQLAEEMPSRADSLDSMGRNFSDY